MPVGSWTESHQREEHVSEAGVVGYRGSDGQKKTWYNHMPASEIRKHIGEDIWRDYFKFTVIRNPFTKLVSAFFYFFNSPHHDVQTKIDGFRQWIVGGKILMDRDKYFIGETLCVDDFIRFECLESDIDRICCKLDITTHSKSIPRFKVRSLSLGIKLQDLYDTTTRNLVEELYAWELEAFQYRFPSTLRL